jgi:proteasome alpha subunit
VMGGADEVVAAYLHDHYTENASLSDALHVAVAALGQVSDEGSNGTGPGDRVIPAGDLEVAVLDRTRVQPRKFLRLMPARLEALLGDRGPTTPHPDASSAAVGSETPSASEDDPAASEIDPADIPDDSPPDQP